MSKLLKLAIACSLPLASPPMTSFFKVLLVYLPLVF